MNINKIKNYNQKLLAILGTLIVLLAIVGLISASYFIIAEIRRDIRYNAQEDGIIAGEELEKLQNEKLRKQVVSYDFPKLVDTVNMKYIIPVSHSSLENPEAILGLLNMNSSEVIDIDSRYSKEYYGAFNNLLVYNFMKNEVHKILKDRVNFENFKIEYFDDDILILFLAADMDTYEDGVINLKDYKSLYLYSFKDNKVRRVFANNSDIHYFKLVDDRKDLILQIGIDKNDNGTYEGYKEPSKLMLYTYKTEEMTDIVDKDIHDILQKTLEGTKD